MPTPKKAAKTSPDLRTEHLDKLRAAFPQFVKDGQVDFDALQAFFKKDGTLAGEEKYGLSWAGKSDAFRAIRLPATGTLAPQEKESKDWDATQNLFLEGDNLEILKLLQTRYREQVKMIYIDPPYNTGKDFVYKDDFRENVSDYYERTGQTKGGIKQTANPESSGRYHSDWLTMMYPRLFLARNLLRDDGVIFVSIDDNEVHNLRMVMDEIFGEEHLLGCIVWSKKRKGSFLSDEFVSLTEYCLIYTKNNNVSLFGGQPDSGESQPIIKRTNAHKVLHFKAKTVKTKLPNGVYSPGKYGTGSNTIRLINKFKVKDGLIIDDFSLEGPFTWTQKTFDEELSKDGSRVVINTQNMQPRVYRVYDENHSKGLASLISGVDIAGTNEDGYEEIKEIFDAEKIFDYPKPVNYTKYLINSACHFNKDALVMDFLAGSGTTAHAVMDLNAEDGGNRKWICVQLPEAVDDKSEAKKAGYNTISEIARERIRRAGEKVKKDYKEELKKREDSLDIGFKALTLRPSNYREWQVLTDKDDEAKLKQQMAKFAKDPLVPKYDEQSVVYEVMLKEGFDLNANVKKEKKGTLPVWTVVDGDKTMIVTFASKVTKAQADACKLGEGDTFVCFDSALDDTTKVNVGRGVKLLTI